MSVASKMAGPREIMHRGMAAVLADPDWIDRDPRDCVGMAIEATHGAIDPKHALEEVLAMRRDRGLHINTGLPMKERIRTALAEYPLSHLQEISVDTIRGIIHQDRNIPGQEIIDAMNDLASEEKPVIEVFWIYQSGNAGGDEVDQEYIDHWKETGKFICPDRGVAIEDPEDKVWSRWRLKS